MGILTTITYHSLLTMLPNTQVFETHCFGEDVGKQKYSCIVSAGVN